MDFTNQHIVLGVCGGIAAYKACEVVRQLQKRGATVTVVMTPDAEAFVGKLTFEALTKRPVITDHLAVDSNGVPWHVALAQQGDVYCILPATANSLAKLAHGMGEDMVTTTALCWTDKPLVVAPAMNSRMWAHPQVTHNRKIVAAMPNVRMVHPTEGLLACGETGPGHLASESAIIQAIVQASHPHRELFQGLSVVITAGGTVEPIDPVRHLTNRSSGRMGKAFADELWAMGANVTLIAGPTVTANVLDEPPYSVIPVTTAASLQNTLGEHLENANLLVMTAAVSDYRVDNVSQSKRKRTKQPLDLTLTPNPDILATVAKDYPDCFTLGFAAETDNNRKTLAKDKLKRKGIDALCLNDVSRTDIGFDSADNELTLFMGNGETIAFPKAPKPHIAQQVLLALAPSINKKCLKENQETSLKLAPAKIPM